MDIRVSDRDASQRFYETVLTVLGRTEHVDDPEYIDWGDFSIVADGRPVAKHLHIAFFAPSHELVDAFHRAGVAVKEGLEAWRGDGCCVASPLDGFSVEDACQDDCCH